MDRAHFISSLVKKLSRMYLRWIAITHIIGIFTLDFKRISSTLLEKGRRASSYALVFLVNRIKDVAEASYVSSPVKNETTPFF